MKADIINSEKLEYLGNKFKIYLVKLNVSLNLEVFMEKEEIFNKVVDVLVEQLGIEKEKVKKESEIIADLGADSLDVVDVVQVLEEEFNVKVPNTDIEKLKTVEDITNYIADKQ